MKAWVILPSEFNTGVKLWICAFTAMATSLVSENPLISWPKLPCSNLPTNLARCGWSGLAYCTASGDTWSAELLPVVRMTWKVPLCVPVRAAKKPYSHKKACQIFNCINYADLVLGKMVEGCDLPFRNRHFDTHSCDHWLKASQHLF